jgi:hypothetical protein
MGYKVTAGNINRATIFASGGLAIISGPRKLSASHFCTVSAREGAGQTASSGPHNTASQDIKIVKPQTACDLMSGQ